MSGLLAAAPAAPALGGAGATAGLLLLLSGVAFMWLVLQGTRYGYDYSLGALLRTLADWTRGIRWIGGKIASVFDAIDHVILAAIANGIDNTEEGMARLWNALAWVVRETVDVLVGFGEDVQAAIEGIIDAEIPQQIGGAVRPIGRELARLRGALRTEAARLTRALVLRAKALELDMDARFGLAWRGIDKITKLVTSAVMPGIRALDRRLDDVVGFTRRNLARRLSRVEALLGAGVIASIALATLTRYFPWWRCTNVRRFMRLLCRSPIGALDWLFALLAFVVVALNPLRVVDVAEDATDELGGLVRTMAGLPRS